MPSSGSALRPTRVSSSSLLLVKDPVLVVRARARPCLLYSYELGLCSTGRLTSRPWALRIVRTIEISSVQGISDGKGELL